MIASLREQHILFTSILLLIISCSSRLKEVDVSEDIAALKNVAIYSGESEPLYDISFERQALQFFIIDDGNRIWVTSPTTDVEVNKWWLLAENGEKLAEFSRPASDRVRTVKDDYAYILETDEETGLQEIVEYRFAMAEK